MKKRYVVFHDKENDWCVAATKDEEGKIKVIAKGFGLWRATQILIQEMLSEILTKSIKIESHSYWTPTEDDFEKGW